MRRAIGRRWSESVQLRRRPPHDEDRQLQSGQAVIAHRCRPAGSPLSLAEQRPLRLGGPRLLDRPANEQLSLTCEGRDGALWLGSWSGAFRYDGVRCEAYRADNSGLITNDIHAICEDDSGAVWFGTSGGVSRLYKGRWTPFQPAGFLDFSNPGPDGTIWFGFAEGIARMIGDSLAFLSMPGVPSSARDLHVDGAGVLWVASYAFGLSTFDGASWKRISEFPDENAWWIRGWSWLPAGAGRGSRDHGNGDGRGYAAVPAAHRHVADVGGSFVRRRARGRSIDTGSRGASEAPNRTPPHRSRPHIPARHVSPVARINPARYALRRRDERLPGAVAIAPRRPGT